MPGGVEESLPRLYFSYWQVKASFKGSPFKQRKREAADLFLSAAVVNYRSVLRVLSSRAPSREKKNKNCHFKIDIFKNLKKGVKSVKRLKKFIMVTPVKKVPIHLQSAANRLLIKGASIVNHDGIEQADVYVEDTKIKQVSFATFLFFLRHRTIST